MKRPTSSKPEIALAAAMINAGLPAFKTEHLFHPTRKWRFDFAWPELKLAAEVEGGVFVRGRHNRPSGFIADCEKYNAAVCGDWLVLRFPVRKDWVADALKDISDALFVARKRVAA